LKLTLKKETRNKKGQFGRQEKVWLAMSKEKENFPRGYRKISRKKRQARWNNWEGDRG